MIPWKLILFLILLLIFVLFAGFNIKNVSDINLGFATVEDVPIFISLFIAFLIGSFVVLPFTLRRKNKHKIEKRTEKKEEKPKEEPADVILPNEPPDNIGDDSM